MKWSGAIPAQSLAVLVLVAAASPASGGGFTSERGCETLSVAPLRILMKFGTYNAHNIGPLCQIRIEPTTDYGVPLNAIIDCVAPAWLSCAVDSISGIATMVATTCTDWWETDSLGIVVGGPTGQYYTYLITTGGGVREWDTIQFSCQAATAVVRSTWGRVKAIYR